MIAALGLALAGALTGLQLLARSKWSRRRHIHQAFERIGHQLVAGYISGAVGRNHDEPCPWAPDVKPLPSWSPKSRRGARERDTELLARRAYALGREHGWRHANAGHLIDLVPADMREALLPDDLRSATADSQIPRVA